MTVTVNKKQIAALGVVASIVVAIVGGLSSYLASTHAVENEIRTQSVIDAYSRYMSATANLAFSRDKDALEKLIVAKSLVLIHGSDEVTARLAAFEQNAKPCENDDFFKAIAAMKAHVGNEMGPTFKEVAKKILCTEQ